MANKQAGAARTAAGFALLAGLTALLLVLEIALGSVNLGGRDVLEALAGRGGATALGIVWQLRLPRALAALLLGGALALSGYLLQTFFHNPLAGPFVLGVSSAAKLTVAITMVAALGQGLAFGSAALVLAAFAGSLASLGFVLLLARRVHGMGFLVVGGVMIGYICGALTDLVVAFAADADIVNLRAWSMGSFSGISWGNLRVIGLVVPLGLAGALLLSKNIAASLLGEGYAASMGVDVRRYRMSLVLLSGLLSAAVTAFAGPISFVGIAVPQLARAGFRTGKPLVLIPACFLGGSAFCLFSDLAARLLFAPAELSVSTVTALLGAPVVIGVLLLRRRGEAV